MKKIIYMSVLLVILSSFGWNGSLECSYVYEAITSQKGQGPFETDASKSNDSGKLTISFEGKAAYLIVKNEKNELFYLGKGPGNMYFMEETPSGNKNLYSIYDDGTLTIAKSYDVIGMAKMITQSILQCIEK